MAEVEVWALEIVPFDQEIDSHARTLRRILHDLGARSSDVTHGRLYILQSSKEQRAAVSNAAIALALDPVLARITANPHPLTATHFVGTPPDEPGEGERRETPIAQTASDQRGVVSGAESAGWIIEVQPHPGVTDAEGDTLAQALARDGFGGVRARAGHRYHVGGELSESLIAEVARELAHEVVERVSWRHAGVAPEDAWWTGAFMPDAAPDPTVERVPLRHLDDRALAALSRERLLSLPLEDLRTIQSHFDLLDRDPTDVELETIAQTWSEHCAHRTFKATIRHREPDRDDQEIHGLLKTFIMSATEEVDRPWVLSAFRDNAGVIAFDRGHEISFKVETHNHPSALEPFGGANTGVGGVVRDVLGVSAEPIANTDVLCFGPLDAGGDALPPGTLPPLEIYEGVVAGIADYGNKMGIPTVNGATLFDAGYVANPLVFCGTVGLAPRNRRPTQPEVGDLVVVAGGRAGRDGIHGATFSSDVLGAPHAELGSVVQIGDPIVEKRLADALPIARDLGLYNAVTDCGAGGLSSAVGEMASELGADVELATVPLKYDGLRPWEIWLSEAQERLVFAVPPQKWPKLQQVFAAEGVEATAIGRFTGDGQLRVRYDGAMVADLRGAFLHDGMPVRTLDSIWYPAATEQYAAETHLPDDLTTLLHRVLADPNVASKESLVRHYDHEVQARTVGKPFVGPLDDGPADAAVLRPVATSWKGIAVSCGINPWYGEIDPYGMALLVIDEALRNAVAVGADPARTAILDNFCWGNPMLPDRLGGLVRAASGCHDAAVALRLPFISGKDSLYNEYRLAGGVSHPIPGTLLISAIGIVPDIRQTVSMALKEPGSALYLVGRTQREMGGSVVSRLSGVTGGTLPALDLKRSREIHGAMHRAIRRGLVRACHDLSEGGLAVAAAEMALAGGYGIDLNLAGLAVSGMEELESTILFGESPTRYLVEVAPENLVAFEQAMGRSPRMIVGEVMAGSSFTVMNRDTILIESDIASLKRSWQQPLAAREVVA